MQTAAAAVRVTARRRRLTPADMEDLRSEVWLKVLRDDRAVLRKFSGRSSLQTYLVSVADRCVLDQQVRVFGKWRPTAKAAKMGSQAILLERLTRRDGLPLEEALAIVRARGTVGDPPLTASAAAIGSNTPRRPRTVPWQAGHDVPSPGGTPESWLEACHSHARAPHVRRALAVSLRALTSDERHLVTRRFVDGDSVATIAREESHDPKPLYRKIEKVLAKLRDELVKQKVSATDVRNLLGSMAGPLDGVLTAGAFP